MARIRQAAAQRLAAVGPQRRDFGPSNSLMRSSSGAVAPVAIWSMSPPSLVFFVLSGCGRLEPCAIDRHAFQSHLPRLDIRVTNVFHVAFAGQVDGLGDGAAQERLGRRHHLQMRQVTDAPLAAKAEA